MEACVGGCCIMWQCYSHTHSNPPVFQGQTLERVHSLPPSSSGESPFSPFIYSLDFNGKIIIYSDSSLIPMRKDKDGLILTLPFFLFESGPQNDVPFTSGDWWHRNAAPDVSSSALVYRAYLLPSCQWSLITVLQYVGERAGGGGGICSTAATGTYFISGLKCSRPDWMAIITN